MSFSMDDSELRMITEALNILGTAESLYGNCNNEIIRSYEEENTTPDVEIIHYRTKRKKRCRIM